MPKVTFVKEHRSVECPSGKLISKVAAELGIAVCRESFIGTGIGDYTIWVRGEPGSVSAPTFMEKLLGVRGWKRFANRTKVLGDIEVWTQAGPDERLRSPRPIAPPPDPTNDPKAKRLGVSDAGTAAFPYGNPLVVGTGKREAVARSTAKAKSAKKGAAAVEETDDEESDEEAAD